MGVLLAFTLTGALCVTNEKKPILNWGQWIGPFIGNCQGHISRNIIFSTVLNTLCKSS
jgi:hypothetical protein